MAGEMQRSVALVLYYLKPHKASSGVASGRGNELAE
jgi:hypothetical protein